MSAKSNMTEDYILTTSENISVETSSHILFNCSSEGQGWPLSLCFKEPLNAYNFYHTEQNSF